MLLLVCIQSNQAIKGSNRNRYRNILAKWDTRVELAGSGGDDLLSYINANYIKSRVVERAYIAASAPTDNTVNDWWRIIWDENVPIIVMLTKLVEQGKAKSKQYWPEKMSKSSTKGGAAYGDVHVVWHKCETHRGFEVNTFRISKGKKHRDVLHVWMQSWPVTHR